MQVTPLVYTFVQKKKMWQNASQNYMLVFPNRAIITWKLLCYMATVFCAIEHYIKTTNPQCNIAAVIISNYLFPLLSNIRPMNKRHYDTNSDK
jgi:hypothetical protein